MNTARVTRQTRIAIGMAVATAASLAVALALILLPSVGVAPANPTDAL